MIFDNSSEEIDEEEPEEEIERLSVNPRRYTADDFIGETFSKEIDTGLYLKVVPHIRSCVIRQIGKKDLVIYCQNKDILEFIENSNQLDRYFDKCFEKR